ncbi:MAG: peptidoglycan-binding protein, partial [Bdellovibrionales bacterium]|nr:peptidoglycan-binding protein [Bdellovibrionales bacterium]
MPNSGPSLTTSQRWSAILLTALAFTGLARLDPATVLGGQSGRPEVGSTDPDNQTDQLADLESAPLVTTTSFPLLRKGDTGDWVRFLQGRLNQLGFTLKSDGDFGKLTDRKVREFQKTNKLKVDGIVGLKTWNAAFPEFNHGLSGAGQKQGLGPRKIGKDPEKIEVSNRLDKAVRDQVRAACDKIRPNDVSFRQAMMFVVQWEGGFTVDHAGETKIGITKPFYEDYLRRKGVSVSKAKPIASLSLDDAVEIYSANIWDNAHCSEVAALFKNCPYRQQLDPQQSNTSTLALVLANGAINYGTGRAFEFLRKAINNTQIEGLAVLEVNRSFDVNCIKAITHCMNTGQVQAIVDCFLDIERGHYDQLGKSPKFSKFYRGWINRHTDMAECVAVRNGQGESSTL